MAGPQDFDGMDEVESEDKVVSKSELKRQMTALQDLGERLVTLTEQQLEKIPMPENLADSVARAKKINKRGGLRRELQFIGKIMRSIDVSPIEEAIRNLDDHAQVDNKHFHDLEKWRERLLNSPDALTEFMTDYPQANVQLLRQLIRNYNSAKNESQKTKAFRQLFKTIRDSIE